MVAAYRARAGAAYGGLCDDPWAAALAGPDGFEVAARFDKAFPYMDLWIAVRTAFIDRRLKAMVAAGFDQVVILGAGLDTRAARLASEGVRFFEVDQPASQALKRERLAALEGYPEGAATFASCDFEREDFLDRLSACGFEAGRPAFFIWEGVTPYLSEQAVRGTLERIAGGTAPASVVIFDIMRAKMAESEALAGQGRATNETLGGLGEPLTWGINDPLPLLVEAGFRHTLTLPFDVLCCALEGSYVREREFRFQSIVQASRATELT